MHALPLSRRKFFALSGTAALAGFAPPLTRVCPALDNADEPEKNAAANAINAFAADLYSHAAGPKSKEKGNLFLSPFSIEIALAMTAAGARGQTYDEMAKVLRLPKEPHAAFGKMIDRLNATGLDKKRSYELSIANAIWAQQGFPWEKAFIELTRKHYGAGVIETNFREAEAARKRINEWVEKETREKIKNLIAPGIIDALTRMVLCNAIYFKSNWLYQFDKKLTKVAPFTLSDGTKAEVSLMSLRGTLNYGEFNMFITRRGEKVQVLELPYAGKEQSMLVFLPEARTGVHRLAQWLTPDMLGRVKTTETDVKVFLPRFKVESEFSLKPVLMDMGMKLAFGAADFTGMSREKGKDLYISHVLHKAFVDVNEEGTEAAAATAVIIKERAAPQAKEFRADRPFVFAIRDNATGVTLFMGRYMGPN